jgi:hypothetical protein
VPLETLGVGDFHMKTIGHFVFLHLHERKMRLLLLLLPTKTGNNGFETKENLIHLKGGNDSVEIRNK